MQTHSFGQEAIQEKQSVLDLVEALVLRNIQITELDKNNPVYTRIEKAVETQLVVRQDILNILERIDSQYAFDKMSGIVDDIMNLPIVGKRSL